MKKAFLHLLLAGVALEGEPAAPPIPVGLWQSQEEGFVIRIEACGEGFCGYAAAPPRNGKNKRGANPACGALMLQPHRWNEAKKRWEGRLQPPDLKVALQSSITVEGSDRMTIRGSWGLMVKTMKLSHFNGKLGAGCQLENP